jgi:preprotein translocase subunit SecG
MLILFIVLIILSSIILGIIVLIQNPKGGGLSSGFSGSNNIMGVQRTGDFLEKGTWALAIGLMVIALLINITIPKGGDVNPNNDIQNQINKPAPVSAPAQAPATLPGLQNDSTKK